MGYLTPEQAQEKLKQRQVAQPTAIGSQASGQETFQKMALMDLLSTGGKNVAKINTIAGLFPQEQKTSAATQKRQLILQQASPVLGRIVGSAMEAPTGMTGAFKAKVGKIPGVTGGQAEYLRRDVEGFARLIASAFASEVGVATNKDVERWKAIMPQPGDTMDERIRQSQKLIDQITSEAQSLGMAIPKEIIEATKLLPSGQGVGQPTQPGIQPQRGGIERLLQGQTLPVAGATIGGLAGGLMGGVPGIAGAGLGYAGGDVIRKNLLDLLGLRQSQVGKQALQDVTSTAGGAVGASALGALGLGVGKLGGKAIGVISPKLMGNKLIQSGMAKIKGNISGSSLVKSLEEWSKSKALPAYMKEEAGNLVKIAKDNYSGIKLDPQTAMSLFLESRTGYTTTGLPKTAIQSAYDRVVRQTLRSEFTKLGGEDVMKGITSIAKNIKFAKSIKGKASMAAMGAGIAAPITYGMYKLLGINKGE